MRKDPTHVRYFVLPLVYEKFFVDASVLLPREGTKRKRIGMKPSFRQQSPHEKGKNTENGKVYDTQEERHTKGLLRGARSAPAANVQYRTVFATKRQLNVNKC